MGRPAVFLDRDGTLIEDPGYINDPAAVRLLPGVGAALARLHRAGFLLLVVTNQSGLARGVITLDQYVAVAGRVAALAAEAGGPLDQQYYCPHLPEISGPCACRKPGLLLFEQAVEEWGVDAAQSWWVGDRIRDISPAAALGGRAILVSAQDAGEDVRQAKLMGAQVVADLSRAAELIAA